MRLVFLVEEQGYQVRFWNELTQEIGEILASSWDHKSLIIKLRDVGIALGKATIEECIRMIEKEEKTFIVLKREREEDFDLSNKSAFIIEKDD